MKIEEHKSVSREGITIRLLQKNEASGMANLVRLFDAVFENEPAPADEPFLEKVLANPQFLAVAAFDETDNIVGGLTGYILSGYRQDAAEVFIYDLAVDPAYQRRGIGRQLLQTLREHCTANGIRETFVPAHEEDEDALAFYRAMGGVEERVRLFVMENPPAP